MMYDGVFFEGVYPTDSSRPNKSTCFDLLRQREFVVPSFLEFGLDGGTGCKVLGYSSFAQSTAISIEMAIAVKSGNDKKVKVLRDAKGNSDPRLN
jgi:hypothetical protein